MLVLVIVLVLVLVLELVIILVLVSALVLELLIILVFELVIVLSLVLVLVPVLVLVLTPCRKEASKAVLFLGDTSACGHRPACECYQCVRWTHKENRSPTTPYASWLGAKSSQPYCKKMP